VHAEIAEVSLPATLHQDNFGFAVDKEGKAMVEFVFVFINGRLGEHLDIAM
jgi:hypothetical protein